MRNYKPRGEPARTANIIIISSGITVRSDSGIIKMGFSMNGELGMGNGE